MKKLFSLSMLAMLALSALSLVSCGSDNDSSETETTATLIIQSDVNDASTTHAFLHQDIANLITTKSAGLASIRNSLSMSYIVLSVLPSNYATVASNLSNCLSEFQALCKNYPEHCHYCKLSIPMATDGNTSSSKTLIYLDSSYILEGTYSTTDSKYQFIATKTQNGEANQFKATFVNDGTSIDGTLDCCGSSSDYFHSTDGHYTANITSYKDSIGDYITTSLFKDGQEVTKSESSLRFYKK